MKSIVALFLLALVFCFNACSPSQEQITTAIALTQAAVPSETIAPTPTIEPTDTPVPTPEPTQTLTYEQSEILKIKDEFLGILREYLVNNDSIKSIELLQGDHGVLQIEATMIWNTKEEIRDASFGLIYELAHILNGMDEASLLKLTGGSDAFSVSITIKSDGIPVKYVATTDYPTLGKLASSALFQSQWVEVTGAKFIE